MAFLNDKYKIDGKTYWLDDSYKSTPTSYKGVSYSYYIDNKLQTKIPYREYYTGPYAMSDGAAFASSCYGNNKNELIRGGRSDYTPYTVTFSALIDEPYYLLTVKNKDDVQIGSRYRYYRYNFIDENNPTIKIWVGMVGGGGGGGRSFDYDQGTNGPSGGGGGGACFFPLVLSAGDVLKVDIGKGGAGTDSSRGAGGDGGDTIAYLNGTVIAIAHGGKGGMMISSGTAPGGSCENKGNLSPFYELRGGAGGIGVNRGDGGNGEDSLIRPITADYKEIVDAWNNGVVNPGGKGAKGVSGVYHFGGGGGAASFKGSKGGCGYGNTSTEYPSTGTIGGGGAGGSHAAAVGIREGSAGGWGQFAVWVPDPSNIQ